MARGGSALTRPHIPQSVLDAAHARKAARLAHDWAEADRRKAEIEAAGWRVVDRGVDFSLRPAQPPDLDDGWRVRYGASGAVPALLAEPASVPVSFVVLTEEIAAPAGDDAGLLRTVTTLRTAAPGLPIVIAAGDPPDTTTSMIRELCASDEGVEAVWTNGPVGPGAAANAALRRSVGEIIVLLAPGVVIGAGAVETITDALADPRIGLAGALGLEGEDPRSLQPAPPGPVRALDGTCLAVRRGEASRVPFDEQYLTWRGAAIAISLTVQSPDAPGGPRLVVALDLPLESQRPDAGTMGERTRAARRDRYRLAEEFGREMGSSTAPPSA